MDWYNKYLGTPYEGGPMPWLYHLYVGHDNNRDFYMLTQKESQVVNDVLYHRWFPQIFLDEHQMGSTGPRMFVPPQADPLAPEVNSLIFRQADLLGTGMSMRLEEAGKLGVGSNMIFDSYWPGGTRNTAWWKNVTGLLTEVASADIATPLSIAPGELRGGVKGLPEYQRQSNFPSPWPGGSWRLRDIIEYELVATRSFLESAARYRETFLTNLYRMAREATERGRTESPGAFVVPAGQHDPVAAARLVDLLLRHGVRVAAGRSAGPALRAGRELIPPGSYVIPAAQPYRQFLLTMLRQQRYPEVIPYVGGPILPPYDVTTWSLPLSMGVEVIEADGLAPLGAGPAGGMAWGRRGRRRRRLSHLAPRGHRLHRAQPAPRRGEEGLLAETTCRGPPRERARRPVAPGQPGGANDAGSARPPVPRGSRDDPAAGRAARRTGVAGEAGAGRPLQAVGGEHRRRVDPLPPGAVRLSLRKPGQHEDERRLLPRQGGHHPAALRWKRTSWSAASRPRRRARRFWEQLPPPYAGGIGQEGGDKLKKWVQDGGTLIALDASADYAIRLLGLPVRNVLDKVSEEDFHCPGSMLRILLDPEHPLTLRDALRGGGLLRATPRPSRPARPTPASGAGWWPPIPESAEDILISGYLQGGQEARKAGGGRRPDRRQGAGDPHRFPPPAPRPALPHVQAAVERPLSGRAGGDGSVEARCSKPVCIRNSWTPGHCPSGGAGGMERCDGWLPRRRHGWKTARASAPFFLAKVNLPGGNVDLPGGNVDLPAGNVNLPGGNVNLPGGNVNLPGGNINLPGGNVNLPGGNVDLPGGNVDLPGGNVDLPGW